MSCQDAQIQIEYSKLLIKSLEYATNNISEYNSNTQNAIITIKELLYKNLVTAYDVLVGFYDFNAKEFKQNRNDAKEDAYQLYAKYCNRLSKCFNINIMPDLECQNIEAREEQEFTVENARRIAYITLQLCQSRVIALYVTCNDSESGIICDAKNILGKLFQ